MSSMTNLLSTITHKFTHRSYDLAAESKSNDKSSKSADRTSLGSISRKACSYLSETKRSIKEIAKSETPFIFTKILHSARVFFCKAEKVPKFEDPFKPRNIQPCFDAFVRHLNDQNIDPSRSEFDLVRLTLDIERNYETVSFRRFLELNDERYMTEFDLQEKKRIKSEIIANGLSECTQQSAEACLAYYESDEGVALKVSIGDYGTTVYTDTLNLLIAELTKISEKETI